MGTARDLIDSGEDVNAQGGEYGNALQAASTKGHQEIVQLLLDKGADITRRVANMGMLYRQRQQKAIKKLLDYS